MVDYAAGIIWLSETAGYTEEKLRGIWQKSVQAFADGEGVHDTLHEKGESFKPKRQRIGESESVKNWNGTFIANAGKRSAQGVWKPLLDRLDGKENKT